MTPTLDRPINGYEQLYRISLEERVRLEAENQRLRGLLERIEARDREVRYLGIELRDEIRKELEGRP